MSDELLNQTSTKLDQAIEATPSNFVGPLPLLGLPTQIPQTIQVSVVYDTIINQVWDAEIIYDNDSIGVATDSPQPQLEQGTT